jgi:nicotinamide phosphoribosyltransferase
MTNLFARLNPILRVDSYKASHAKQYPAGATRVSSYIESRGGDFEQTVFFGLQAFIKQYMLTPITKADVKLAQRLFTKHGVPFEYDGWMRIVEVHNGYLPLRIDALPERRATSSCRWSTPTPNCPG